MANLKIAMRRSHGKRRITKMRAESSPMRQQKASPRFDGKPTERREVTVGPQDEMIQMFRLISARTNSDDFKLIEEVTSEAADDDATDAPGISVIRPADCEGRS